MLITTGMFQNYNYNDAVRYSNRKLFSETETQSIQFELRCISSTTIKRPVSASGLQTQSRNFEAILKVVLKYSKLEYHCHAS